MFRDPNISAALTTKFKSIFEERFPDLSNKYKQVIRPNYMFDSSDGNWRKRTEEEIDELLAQACEGRTFLLAVRAEDVRADFPDKLEYGTTGKLSIVLLEGEEVAANVFNCYVKHTQYNCGLREVTHISTNGAVASASTHGSIDLALLGFDVLLEAVTNYAHVGNEYKCGQLLMSHSTDNYITEAALKHPMWREILRGNNPNYGGYPHEYVMFVADIHHKATRSE